MIQWKPACHEIVFSKRKILRHGMELWWLQRCWWRSHVVNDCSGRLITLHIYQGLHILFQGARVLLRPRIKIEFTGLCCRFLYVVNRFYLILCWGR